MRYAKYLCHCAFFRSLIAWNMCVESEREYCPGRLKVAKMNSKLRYKNLETRSDKRTREMCLRGAGVRASTIWHDRYVSRMTPDQIAKDRDIKLEVVYEALEYCQENWEIICREKDRERELLEQRGFFEGRQSDRP